VVDGTFNGFVFHNLKEVKSQQLKSHLQCLFAIHLNRDKEVNSKMLGAVYNSLSSTWSALDSEIEKIEIGFLICSTLAEVDKTIAKEYATRADSLKRTIWPDSINTIEVYTTYAQLLLKSFGGLILKRKYDDKTLSKVIEIVSAIPAPTTRLQLWCYLATLAQIKGDINLRIKIFDDLIKPTFDGLADKNQQNSIFVGYSYQFYLDSQLFTMKQLEALPTIQREDALRNIVEFVLYERLPHERYDTDNKAFSDKLTIDELSTVCQLIEKLEIDSHIYSRIEQIVKAAIDLKATPVQKESLLHTLEKIVNNKLPNADYIKHPGYKIIANAQLLRFEKDGRKQESVLDKILIDVEDLVPNLSDKAFIYTTLSDIAPFLKGTKYSKVGFITKSLELIDLLDFSLESAYRTELLLRRLRDTNENLWKQRLLKEFKNTIASHHNVDALELQRRLIDHAYRHDATFAKTLVNLLDNEDVRMEYRRKKHLNNFYEALRVKKDIIDDKIPNGKQSAFIFADACEASLASLNANKIASKKISDMRYYLDYAIKTPTSKAFSIYSFYIQNIVRRYEDKPEGAQLFHDLIDSLVSVCKFIQVIVQRYKLTAPSTSKLDFTEARKKIFKAGERDVAFNFIKSWLEQNEFTYLKICDPYFSPSDLGLLKLVLEVKKNVDVQILTSVEGNGNFDVDVLNRYAEKWREISDEDPGFATISITKIRRTNTTPVHDRWILMDKVGLHIGASFNGLGIAKASQIIELNFAEKVATEMDVFDPLFDTKRKDFNGERVDTLSFTLG
jgi:hypothetical protein